MVFSDVLATRARDGRICTPPAVGDAAVGLAMLTLPLLAPVVWLTDPDAAAPRSLLLAWAVVYSVGLVVAMHGLMSDLSPLRGRRRYVPTRAVVLGTAYAIGLPWGAAMVVAPGDAASQAAARRGEILPTATPDPSATPTPTGPPSSMDLWVASGGTVGIGRVVLALAVLSVLVLAVLYLRSVLSHPWDDAGAAADA